MTDCNSCQYADRDYEDFYGTTQRQYFVCGCKKELDLDAEDCEGYSLWQTSS